MRLKVYLATEDKRVKTLAEEIGMSREYLSEIINKKRFPGKKIAQKIEIATNGKVKAKDLIKKRKRAVKPKFLVELN